MGNSSFKQLFNGRDLTGWKMAGDGQFTVEDGLLRTRGGMGLLWYAKEKVGNAILRVVYRVSRDEDNSGVFVRIADMPSDPWYAVHNGYEVQILAAADDLHNTGSIYSMTRSLARAQMPAGEWNTMDIELNGSKIAVVLNGTLVTRFDDSDIVPERQFDYEPERGPRPEYGYIGLQNHDDESEVYFREVSVRQSG